MSPIDLAIIYGNIDMVELFLSLGNAPSPTGNVSPPSSHPPHTRSGTATPVSCCYRGHHADSAVVSHFILFGHVGVCPRCGTLLGCLALSRGLDPAMTLSPPAHDS